MINVRTTGILTMNEARPGSQQYITGYDYCNIVYILSLCIYVPIDGTLKMCARVCIYV